jgi:hypothetical protein
MRTGEQLDKIADAIENTEIDESTLESNEEVTSTRSNSAGITAEDFPEPETVEESAEELANVEKSTADKT